MSFLLSLMFFLQQNQRARGRNRVCQEGGVGQTMYKHVSKCKNYKIKKEYVYIYIYMCVYIYICKFFKGEEVIKRVVGGEFDQRTLYASIQRETSLYNNTH
jgi:hypothetical protein